jgi:hypothetical protein
LRATFFFHLDRTFSLLTAKLTATGTRI